MYIKIFAGNNFQFLQIWRTLKTLQVFSEIEKDVNIEQIYSYKLKKILDRAVFSSKILKNNLQYKFNLYVLYLLTSCELVPKSFFKDANFHEMNRGSRKWLKPTVTQISTPKVLAEFSG